MIDIFAIRKKKRGYKTKQELEAMTRDEIYALAKKRGYKVKRNQKKQSMIIEFMMHQ